MGKCVGHSSPLAKDSTARQGVISTVEKVAIPFNSTLASTLRAWRMVTIIERSKRLQSTILYQDERMAQMTARVEELEATASRALRNIHEASDGEERAAISTCSHPICMSCANETPIHVRCTRGHVLCIECVDRTADMLLMRMEPPPADCPCVAMVTDEEDKCSGVVAQSDLVKTFSGQRLCLEINHLATMQRTLSLVERFCTSDSTANALTIRLQRLRADGSYRAYACARCGFGPLDHAHCGNLMEHHERDGIDNSCPNCGEFASDVQQLVIWRDLPVQCRSS